MPDEKNDEKYEVLEKIGTMTPQFISIEARADEP